MQREFTGRHMLAVMVGGFSIVVAVNMLMATLATNGFGGIIVENSYVASQKFNGWLEEAKRAEALGWSAEVERDQDGILFVRTEGVPEGALITAELRRPLGENETAELAFTSTEANTAKATQPIANGRWIVRLIIVAGADRWAAERKI